MPRESGLTYLSQMRDHSGPGPAEPLTGASERQAEPAVVRGTDLRQQLRWVPLTAGLAALIIGLGYVVEGLLPGLYHRRLRGLSYIAPGTLANLTRTTDVIIGLLLLMLSHGLRRRKRRAWAAVMALLAVALVIHAGVGVVLHHLQPEIPLPRLHFSEVVVSVALLVALYAFRRQFYAVGDRRSRWRALWVLGCLVAADVIIGLSYLAFIAELKGNPTVEDRLQTVVQNLAGFTGPIQFAGSPHLVETQLDHFGFIMGGLGLFTLVVALFILLRPAEPAGRLRAVDADRIRQLLERYGDQDSLGYFALRDDKSIVWSPTGKACIGYRVLSGVMLASGDPIGDPEAWPGAIHTFLDEAARHAWVPAVIGCGELGAEVWCREGNLTALELGDEAIVSVADFTLQGRPMRNVRQMVSRVCRQGYTAEIRRVADIPTAELDRMTRQADSWRGNPTERGFSMALGRVGGVDDGRCVIATATEDGVLRAMLHFVPWGSDGLSLDLMRRDRSATPGLNDFMIVEVIKAANDLGVKRISLNFAVFRAALERGERIGAGPVLRAWRGFLLFLSRWFQIESLYKFNAKFCPEWVPRFVVFPSTRDAPRIGFAALEAEAFLVWPTIEIRRIGRKLGLGRLQQRLRLGAKQAPARR
ncbi:MAG TPA: phosphatidylglycerol lysyltransferase domain-containing protein [Streptosporangiaceae bacterium]|nr:phosphatidylglycerol lysyltransferase domain-containing protein [Streptosporangiaceae bacterium]